MFLYRDPVRKIMKFNKFTLESTKYNLFERFCMYKFYNFFIKLTVL